MRVVMFLALTAVLTVASSSPHTQSADVRASIDAASRKFEAGWAGKDAAAVAALYTTDAIVMPPNGPVAKGSQAVLEMWKAALAAVPGPVRLTTSEVAAHGDVAHEIGTYEISGAGGKVVDKGKFIVIWKKEGGQWKLHRDIWNSDMPAAGM